MKHAVYIRLFAATALLTRLYGAAVVPTATTWNSGTLENWTVTGAAVTVPLTGGVTGGYLRVEDNVSDDMTLYAPEAYRGDYTALDNAAFFTVALRTLYQGSDIWPPFGTLTLSGPGGKYKIDMGDPPPVSSGWKIFSAPLAESAWTRVSGSWLAMLANVTGITLDVEGGSAITEINGIDDFQLVAGSLDTVRITDIRVNHCGCQEFGWYFNGSEGITRVDIVFSEAMLGAASISNFALEPPAGDPAVPAPTLIYYDAAAYTTTMAWGTALVNRSFSVRCRSGAANLRSALFNVPLDGELSNPLIPVLPSGNGTPGGDAVFTINHLTADINRDTHVDLLDFALLATNWLNHL